MADLFDGASITLPCPNCKHTTRQKVTFLESNRKIICPNCQKTIQIDANQFKKGRQQINKAVDDLKRKFK